MNARIEDGPPQLPAPSDLPGWLWEQTSSMFALAGADGWFASNGHVILAVSSEPRAKEYFRQLPKQAAQQALDLAALATVAAEPGRPFTRPVIDDEDLMIDIKLGSSIVVDVRYLCLIERLYPGCLWRTPAAEKGCCAAFCGDRLVALVMPRKPVTGYA